MAKSGSRKKLPWIILGAIVVVVIVIANFAMDRDTATSVQAEEAKSREIVELVSASGRIQPQTAVDITSEINAEIIGIFAEEGDRVEGGELLILLDTVQAQSDAEQARYQVNEITARRDGAKTQLDQAKEEYERQKRLYELEGTSEQVFKNARYAYQNAKASYEAIQAQASQMQARYNKSLDNLSKTRIHAPMNGVVTFVDAEVGEIAAAQTAFTQGRTLMTVSNLDVFEVEVEVDETEITKVTEGQRARIEVDAYPDTTFRGEVVDVGNTAILAGMGTQDQSTDFRVKVTFQDRDVDIRTGMSATVDIITSEKPDVVSIPYSAVVMRSLDMDSLKAARKDREMESSSGVHAADDIDTDTTDEEDEREDVRGVFVIREGKAVFVPIETGIADNKFIEVTSGLQDGDSVVAGPYRVLRTIDDGDEVKPRSKNNKKNGGE
ncbi:efflux RND transporter periplasmic adaptor subunit [candidate division GN15 bacterium]|nr:efflux RND transporter periplasmic adaptor subunit [candidate division GN15 bacterium]